MAARRKKPSPVKVFLKAHSPKLLALLGATGAAGGVGGVSYSQSEKVAVVESKVERLEQDGGQMAKDLKRVDRRTIRMEERLKAIADKLGAQRSYGPEEE